MVRWIKPALGVMALFTTVWLLVFFYWQSTARMPSTGDVVVGLLLLPIGLLLGGLLLRKATGGSMAGALAAGGAAVASPPARASKDKNKAHDPQKTDAEEAQFRVSVLAASVRTPGGASAAELAAAITDGKGVEPDVQLRNDAGFPVFASRIAALEIEELREQLADMPLAQSGEVDADALADDRLRAIMALGEALIELLPAADVALQTMADAARAAAASASATARLDAPPQPRMSLLLPGWWSEPERLLATQWVQHLSVAESPAHAWAVNCFRNEPGLTALALADRINLALNREAQPALWIVLASESAISDARVAQWEAQGLLYAATRRGGAMPGEAAAGLLLAGTKGRPVEIEAPQISRLVTGQLPSAPDAAKVSYATVLSTLADRLLATARLEASAIDWVVSDADHRVSRVTEVAKLLQDRLPHVPFDGNHLATGAACAHMGAAGDLVGVALGCYLAMEHAQRVLVTSLGDPLARAAVLVAMPPAPPSDLAT